MENFETGTELEPEKIETLADNTIESQEEHRVLTPELLLSDRKLLEKLYQKLTVPVKRTTRTGQGYLASTGEEPDYYGVLDFGPEYGEIDCSAIYFYVVYQLGLPTIHSNYENAVKYLTLFYENPAEAKKFLDEERTKHHFDKTNHDFLAKGFNLSGVIPGAPEIILDRNEFEHEHPHSIDSRSTPKVDDLIEFVGPETQKEEHLKKLKAIFTGKTVIDFGSGGDMGGLMLASKLGAKNYVAVEPYNASQLLTQLQMDAVKWVTKVEGNYLEGTEIDKIHLAQTDIKTFLDKLPDKLDDLVYVISGLDQFILGTFRGMNTAKEEKAAAERDQYVEDTNRLLSEVLARTKNGAVVSYASILSPSQPPQGEDFDVERLPSYEGNITIFRNQEGAQGVNQG